MPQGQPHATRRTTLTAGLALALLCSAAVAGVSAPADAAPSWKNQPRGTLESFASDAELRRYLKRARRAQPPAPSPAPTAAMESAAPADGVAASSPAQGRAADESITNTQEAGVDEGGIVKMRGDTLVILRRGRLFTVSTRNGGLRPIDAIDAFPPGVDPRSDWYDEMLVAGNRVIVIGYSYGRGGTEINRFRIDNEGHLDFEDAHHLRSNDYYSSRNYASRLIGTRLIVYSPLYLPYGSGDNLDWLPGLRRWSGSNSGQGGFRRIVSPRDIYIPSMWRDEESITLDALHTVTSCDLAAPVLNCRATSVLGPAGRVFYVSANAVYVWATPSWWGRREDRKIQGSLLYRMPLDGGPPSAVGVRGAPIDQFSFREDWDDGRLNVLLRSEGGGENMWSSEFTAGSVALLQLPLNAFGDGSDEARRSNYRPLPSPDKDQYHFQNRFVGDYVLYATGNSWGRPRDRTTTLVVAAVRGNGASQIPLRHGVDRIEAMGRDALVVGSDTQDLNFQAVELTAGRPRLGDRYTLEGAAQGETRSHAFFFKPEPRGWDDPTAGVVGLPVARAGRPGYRQLVENSAAMIFIRRANRDFSLLGEIGAREEGIRDDGCRASCVDWYGNARPIFLRNRTFALMGYEIVEGELSRASIRELRRINFAPTTN
jgi:hypothetical protein